MTIVEPITQPEQQLERKALSRVEQARAIKITGQASYEFAAGELQGVVSLRKEIVDHHAPLKQTTHAAWQAAIAAEKKVLEPVAEAERIIKGEIGRYTIEQEQIRREEQRRLEREQERQRLEQEAEGRRLQEEADRAHAEEVERQIEQAEAKGAAPEYIAQLAETPAPVVAVPEPVFLPTPVVAPRVAPVTGVSAREVWSGEVTSMVALAAHVAVHPEHINLIAPNMIAINGLARSLKSALNIPGIRAVTTANIAVRSK